MVMSQAWILSFRIKLGYTENKEGIKEERREGKQTGTKAENGHCSHYFLTSHLDRGVCAVQQSLLTTWFYTEFCLKWIPFMMFQIW
jgi:hypothetical protein